MHGQNGMKTLLEAASYEALHVSHDYPCSIDLADFADLFTVDTYIHARNNPKISAQADEPFSRYMT